MASNYDAKDGRWPHSGSGMLAYRASLTTSDEEVAMSRQKEKLVDKEELFIGIDLHKQRYPYPLFFPFFPF